MYNLAREELLWSFFYRVAKKGMVREGEFAVVVKIRLRKWAFIRAIAVLQCVCLL